MPGGAHMTSEPDLRRPLTLADFINRLIGILRVGLWPMLLTAMALIIPAAILSAAQNIFVEAFLPAETDPASLGDVEVSSALWFLCLIVLGSLVSFLLIGLANIAITYQSDQAARNRPATVGEGLSVGWAKMPAYIQMTLVQFVVYLLFALLAVGLLWFSAGVTGGDPLAALIGFASICGLGLLIVAPLLYITTRWSLATSAWSLSGSMGSRPCSGAGSSPRAGSGAPFST